MKISDLVEASTPNNWKSIIQMPNGEGIVNILLTDNTLSIPNNATVQELPNKAMIDPSTLESGTNFIYLMMGVPRSDGITVTQHAAFVKMPDRSIPEYELWNLSPVRKDLRAKYKSFGHSEVSDHQYAKSEIEQKWMKPSEHTWLITWPDEERPNLQFDRRLAQKRKTTPQEVAARLAPLKLSIVTQAALTLKRQDPESPETILLLTIRQAMLGNQPNIQVIRYGLNGAINLDIKEWWITRVDSVLRNNLSTKRRLTVGTGVGTAMSALDSTDFPKGLFATLPTELVKQIITWAKIAKYKVVQ